MKGNIFEELFSPNIRVAMDHKSCHPYILHNRVIFDYEFLFMAQGILSICIEDRNFTLQTGDILIIKPGVHHSFTSISSGVLHMPHIHLDLIYYEDFEKLYTSFKPLELFTQEDKSLIRPDLLGNSGFYMPEHIAIGNTRDIYKIFLEIIRAHNHQEPFYKIKEKELFFKLFHILCNEVHIKSDPSLRQHQDSIQKVKDLLDEKPELSFTLKQLAKHTCISEFHLERLFKKMYGQPIQQYQLKRRMEKAKELLQYSKMSITQIASTVGYTSIHAFSKAFHKNFGLCPRDYIKKCTTYNND